VGASTMFDRMREQPAKILQWKELFGRQRFLVSRHTYLEFFTSVLMNICAQCIAHQKVCLERIDHDSLDVSDYL